MRGPIKARIGDTSDPDYKAAGATSNGLAISS
ncbi:hypothetical protein FHS84_000310 [Rhizomicrobium electricum]|nr:hypothetical protein [Rhizomicrobium electricum]